MKYTIEEKKLFAANFEKRTKDFGVKVILTLRHLKEGDEGRIIKNQIFRSATSIGANYRESNRSRSKADFRSKIRICEAEASDTNIKNICHTWIAKRYNADIYFKEHYMRHLK